ncbi:rod shape-determining protein MreD [Streptomyces xiaopingdaonensis]|uniref:rod shape-determining protein MreD n=1 Tax=Streptomyces xiaopingdaonensis TaxID=1565415 RepID=UPI0004942B0A|nr:rod shape-determining protein MreD [Streptomyces xiaopingdaonensis]
MYVNRVLLSAFLVVVALIVQVSVLARLQLPGAVPDLLLLTVLGLAMVYGHTAGAAIGFFAGLLADLAPPADHAVGRYALVLCLIGYAAGLTRPEKGGHRSATVPMLVVACTAAASTLLYAGVGALVGDTAARSAGLGALVLTATVYDLLLAPFTVPWIMWLARRTEKKDPMAETSGLSDRLFGLSGGTGLGLGGGTGLLGRGRSGRSGVGGGKSVIRRSSRGKVGKIKGVKKL